MDVLNKWRLVYSDARHEDPESWRNRGPGKLSVSQDTVSKERQKTTRAEKPIAKIGLRRSGEEESVKRTALRRLGGHRSFTQLLPPTGIRGSVLTATAKGIGSSSVQRRGRGNFVTSAVSTAPPFTSACVALVTRRETTAGTGVRGDLSPVLGTLSVHGTCPETGKAPFESTRHINDDPPESPAEESSSSPATPPSGESEIVVMARESEIPRRVMPSGYVDRRYYLNINLLGTVVLALVDTGAARS
ncbi:hypothetical protein KPH14_012174 [Odynerus spinipes]|uniref:Uncharacterized protein n=1 Tax=Odynerus spinipes TaxID=1348599 RepID=A0AAD9VM22_9HYME|nr:hypothetical protein KPH14_012174 [Odynerus spinipes]